MCLDRMCESSFQWLDIKKIKTNTKFFYFIIYEKCNKKNKIEKIILKLLFY